VRCGRSGAVKRSAEPGNFCGGRVSRMVHWVAYKWRQEKRLRTYARVVLISWCPRSWASREGVAGMLTRNLPSVRAQDIQVGPYGTVCIVSMTSSP
jgi:hypothetical protein